MGSECINALKGEGKIIMISVTYMCRYNSFHCIRSSPNRDFTVQVCSSGTKLIQTSHPALKCSLTESIYSQ